MAQTCPNCHKKFDHTGKYCSVRCSREARRQLLPLWIASVAGILTLVFVTYTAPGGGLRPEPTHPVPASELQRLAKDDSCPVCTGKTKVDCRICIAGKIFYMGTSAECGRCSGRGWLDCPACKGSGKLRDALANATS